MSAAEAVAYLAYLLTLSLTAGALAGLAGLVTRRWQR